jgi:hypothetical protein
MVSHRPISTAPHDGTLIRFWCRSEVEPVIGCWSRMFIGWVAYHEDIPLIRHDVSCEPIADQAAAAPSRWRRCGAGLSRATLEHPKMINRLRVF